MVNVFDPGNQPDDEEVLEPSDSPLDLDGALEIEPEAAEME